MVCVLVVISYMIFTTNISKQLAKKTEEMDVALKNQKAEVAKLDSDITIISGRTTAYNTLYLGIKPDGTQTVSVGSPPAWREALGINKRIDGVLFDYSKNVFHYGTCGTAAGTKAKAATLTGSQSFTLETGSTVYIKMTNANTASAPTLNVNSSGAKSIKRVGTTDIVSWEAGSVIAFIYDGTNWIMMNGSILSTNFGAVDPSRILATNVSDTVQVKEYTATEDCYLFSSNYNNGGIEFTLDGVKLVPDPYFSMDRPLGFIPMKKGQKLKCNNGYYFRYRVYGIKR